jgi:hypothetical protein
VGRPADTPSRVLARLDFEAVDPKPERSADDGTLERERAGRPGRRLARALVSANSYGLVLLLIVVTYLLTVSLHGTWAPSVVLAFQIATVWFTLRTSRARRSVRLAADALLVVAGAVAAANVLLPDHVGGTGFVFAAGCVLYLIAPFSIVRHIALRPQIDQETMLGAIAAYLMIGMFFAFAYRFLGVVQAGPFFGAQGEGTMSQDLFFSFITLTTTGYGNLVPAANPGQSLAVLEAVTGQLFLVTAVGKIVTAWKPKRLSSDEARPPTEPPE